MSKSRAPGRPRTRPSFAINEEPHPGYRLTSWEGTVTDDLAETYAESRHAMGDMPMGSTDFGTVTWDPERLGAAAAAVGRGQARACGRPRGRGEDRHS